MNLLGTKIYITEEQKRFLKNNYINLSKFCRAAIEQFKESLQK